MEEETFAPVLAQRQRDQASPGGCCDSLLCRPDLPRRLFLRRSMDHISLPRTSNLIVVLLVTAALLLLLLPSADAGDAVGTSTSTNTVLVQILYCAS